MALLRIAGLVSLLAAAVLPAGAAEFKVLHAFCSKADCKDGSFPSASVVDASGNLYGGLLSGAKGFEGGVFEITPGAARWRERIVHGFCKKGSPCRDGLSLYSGLSADTAGNLYGSTEDGGNQKRGGVVFKLTRNEDGSYEFQRIYAFCKLHRCADGKTGDGHIVADTAGNVYGTAVVGGNGHGVVYELSPPPLGKGDWTEKVLYAFCSRKPCTDGGKPLNGLTYAGEATGAPYDGTSALYGTANLDNPKVIYRLTPNGDGTWSQSVLHKFCREADCVDGATPADYGALVVDKRLNIYGATTEGGAHGAGTLYRLSPHGNKWRLNTLYDFCTQGSCADGEQPWANPVMDASGRLYGTTILGGAHQSGTIYRFARDTDPQMSVIYSFCGACGDGQNSEVGVIVDGAGNLFGANRQGGANGGGTAYELIP